MGGLLRPTTRHPLPLRYYDSPSMLVPRPSLAVRSAGWNGLKTNKKCSILAPDLPKPDLSQLIYLSLCPSVPIFSCDDLCTVYIRTPFSMCPKAPV